MNDIDDNDLLQKKEKRTCIKTQKDSSFISLIILLNPEAIRPL